MEQLPERGGWMSFQLKMVGKVKVWDVLNDNFTLETPTGDITIKVTDGKLRNDLVDAMAFKTDVYIIIGGE